MIDPAPMDFMINHMSKLAYGESVGDRIQQIEAEKQQAETRAQQVELNSINALLQAGFQFKKSQT